MLANLPPPRRSRRERATDVLSVCAALILVGLFFLMVAVRAMLLLFG
ncbi:MAG: hypothetical protein ACM3X5_03670 [Bacillota bacterium]